MSQGPWAPPPQGAPWPATPPPAASQHHYHQQQQLVYAAPWGTTPSAPHGTAVAPAPLAYPATAGAGQPAPGQAYPMAVAYPPHAHLQHHAYLPQPLPHHHHHHHQHVYYAAAPAPAWPPQHAHPQYLPAPVSAMPVPPHQHPVANHALSDPAPRSGGGSSAVSDDWAGAFRTKRSASFNAPALVQRLDAVAVAMGGSPSVASSDGTASETRTTDASADSKDPIASLLEAYAASRATDTAFHATVLRWANVPALAALAAHFAAELAVPGSAAWADLNERRGTVLVAVLDGLLANRPGDSSTAAVAGAVVDAFVAALPRIAESQLGCIAAMRLVIAIHHRAELVTPLIAGLARHADAFAHSGGEREHAAYVLGHVLQGLDAEPQPLAPAAAASVSAARAPAYSPAVGSARPRIADCQRRAEYVVEFPAWLASANSAAKPPPAESSRGRCDPATWAAFTRAVLATLTRRVADALDGRQLTVLLWHALDRIPLLRGDDVSSVSAELIAKLAASGGIRVPASPPPTPTEGFAAAMKASLDAPSLTPVVALSRCAAGRLAILAALRHASNAAGDLTSPAAAALRDFAADVAALRVAGIAPLPAAASATPDTRGKPRLAPQAPEDFEERVSRLLAREGRDDALH